MCEFTYSNPNGSKALFSLFRLCLAHKESKLVVRPPGGSRKPLFLIGGFQYVLCMPLHLMHHGLNKGRLIESNVNFKLLLDDSLGCEIVKAEVV